MCVYWNNAWNFDWCPFKLFYHRSFNFRLFLFVLIMSLMKAWHVNSVIYITVFKLFALKPLTIKRGILLQAVIIYYIIQIIFREILLKCWILVNWLIFRVYKKKPYLCIVKYIRIINCTIRMNYTFNFLKNLDRKINNKCHVNSEKLSCC